AGDGEDAHAPADGLPWHRGPRQDDEAGQEPHHDQLGKDQVDRVGADEVIVLAAVEDQRAAVATATDLQPALEHGRRSAVWAAELERPGEVSFRAPAVELRRNRRLRFPVRVW